MRYYPAVCPGCPEDERGWHQGSAMACAPQGRQGMLLAKLAHPREGGRHALPPHGRRTHHRRGCPQQLPVLSLLSARHATDTGHDTTRRDAPGEPLMVRDAV